MAKKKAEDMREQLRTIIMYTRGRSAWDELLKTEADIRKRRQKMIYEQKERQRFWIDMALSAVIVLVALAGLWWFVDWIMEIHKAGGTNFQNTFDVVVSRICATTNNCII